MKLKNKISIKKIKIKDRSQFGLILDTLIQVKITKWPYWKKKYETQFSTIKLLKNKIKKLILKKEKSKKKKTIEMNEDQICHK
jgi:hypothetical protein